MLDLEFIRKNPETVRRAIRDKGDKVDLDNFLEIDRKRREIITYLDKLRNERRLASEQIAKLKKENRETKELIQKMKVVSDEISKLEENERNIEKISSELLSWIPNIPAQDVPVGKDAEDNLEIRHWGERSKFDFTPLPHWEIGQKLGIMQLDIASKIATSGFELLSGSGARLERALINFMIDLHTKKHGYTEIMPPYLVNEKTMFTTGQLPKLENDMYKTREDDLFLIPTAEVPLTNIWRDAIIPEEKLPIYYVAATPCFRREAGSYGKDTRGITRVHQFNKVELLKFTHPDTSFDELEKLVLNAEAVLQALELEYRVMKLCTAEMSFSSAKTYDIEAFAPGLGRYLEVSSCGNFTDFQARRGNIRFKDKNGKTKFVHTLNGSGVALPRILICLLETYQQKDGSVLIPTAVRPYMDGVEKIT
jgi:seryl-tRNA synthetase